MNTLDLIILIPIVLGFVFGLFKGLIKELTSFVAIVLGIYVAKIFAPFVSEILINQFKFSDKTARPFAYFFLFLFVIIGLLLLAKVLDKIFDSIALGGLNKFLGGLFGALKYALIVSVLLNVVDALDSRFSLVRTKTKSESIAFKPIKNLAPALWEETKSSKTFDFKEDSVNEENRNRKSK
ncbi:MAG: CvpA family protein [Paludibacter sp.]|nr:CvpA family protein [Paludibacter sp.]